MKKIGEETKNNYFCVILDLFARKTVGKKISTKNSTQLTKSTLRIAYKSRKSQFEPLHTEAFCESVRS